MTDIKNVVAAMAAHLKHQGVQEHACGAMFYLAANEANRVRIGEAGGIQGVVAAMAAHLKHQGVQHKRVGRCSTLH